ncbi:MAG: transcriptional regulator MraZ [Azospirillum brasilense]|nr:MAG: transcriptional regulator MraZ [Azospirillum brasilense]
MALFLSTFEKQIDKKGRVSVPPSFRAVLAAQNFNGMVAYQSFVHPCIEACGMERLEKLYARIETLDPFSEEHDAFTTAILAGSVQLAFDGEGRVVIPEALLNAAGITGNGVFVGKGATFEIWAPEAFAKHQAAARELALKKRLSLKAELPTGGAA